MYEQQIKHVAENNNHYSYEIIYCHRIFLLHIAPPPSARGWQRAKPVSLGQHSLTVFHD